MSQIEKDMVVGVHYRGTFTGTDEEFDTSAGRDPMVFLCGHGQMIPGFEKALLGAKTGDSHAFDLAPEEAYGPRDEEAIQEMAKDNLPADVNVGDMLAGRTAEGQVVQFVIKEIGDDVITVDLNHPMAGKSLTFAVDVVEVRPATAEELSHGHVHGPGGHHH
jgi:FKBP-type peptidyl-prolyl cis-trans isomerase SlyD